MLDSRSTDGSAAHPAVDRVDAVRVRLCWPLVSGLPAMLAASVSRESVEEPESRLMLETRARYDIVGPLYAAIRRAPADCPEPLADDEDERWPRPRRRRFRR